MEINYHWLQSNILAIVAVVITLVFAYQYLIEKGSGVKLSKRYRNSIFETQSKIFLNATQYLISGNKDLAIKEFLNAVDLNRETIETYFALGGLFRSNGDVEKAISIHRSLIVRENISESTRLEALKELAIDFDKGGFIDKAIETYKDVLKINRDQHEVVHALCRIYEDIEDWDQAYNYRVMLSKVGHNNQSETISHILVQKAKKLFEDGNLIGCSEELEDAFRYAPSVSAKILRLKLSLVTGNIEESENHLVEIVKEHPHYTSFIFVSLEEKFKAEEKELELFFQRMDILKRKFLEIEYDVADEQSSSIILAKVRLLKNDNTPQEAYDLIKKWMEEKKNISEALKIEYIKVLIELEKKDELVKPLSSLLENIHESLTRHFCKECGFNSESIFWRCPQCKAWETIQFRWKV